MSNLEGNIVSINEAKIAPQSSDGALSQRSDLDNTIPVEVRNIRARQALQERERRMRLIRAVSGETSERTRLVTYEGFFPIDYGKNLVG